MIVKALADAPDSLFLDEPTAGVDVELRHDMWQMVRGLRERGVTVILTTHDTEEAQDMADRIGVINKGELVVVEDKDTLMRRLGRKIGRPSCREDMWPGRVDLGGRRRRENKNEA